MRNGIDMWLCGVLKISFDFTGDFNISATKNTFHENAAIL